MHRSTGAGPRALAGAAVATAVAAGGALPGGPVARADDKAVSAARTSTLTIALATAGGPFGEQNRSIRQGALVRVAEVNAGAGIGHRVRLRTVPLAVDGLSAPALRGRLSALHADVLVLPCDSDGQLRVVPAAASLRTLMLAPCAPDASFGRRFPTYWAVGAAGNSETAGVASFIATAGYGRVFTIAGRGPAYGSLLERYFVNAAPLSRLRVVGRAGIGAPGTDVAGLARAISGSHATAIFTSLQPPLVGRVVRGLRARQVMLPVFGTAAMDTPTTLRGGVRALQQAVVASYGFARESPGGRQFRSDYRRRFRSKPVGSFPGLGYESVRLLEAAVRHAGSPAPSAIQRALAGGLRLHGVALPDREYPRGGSHNPVTSVAIAKIAGHRFLPLFAGVPMGRRIPPP